MRLWKTSPAALAVACLSMAGPLAKADSYSVQTFATGTSIGANSPDSVEFGDGSLWIAYTNGADSTGASGSSNVIRYSTSGSVMGNWTIAGNVDGLRVDPATGLVWAMQNNDGNSALTVINPVTGTTTPYSYGSSYTANGNSLTRGFDDAVFEKGQVFYSETNPASGTDPVVVRLTNGLSSAPLQIAGILDSTFTGTNLATGKQASTTITDSDSLIKMPNGDLALTGEADQEIVFIHNPGITGQSESFLHLLGANGVTVSGFPDDTAFVTAKTGLFYIADTGGDTVYRIAANDLTPGSVYIDVGTEFASLNLSTGVVTPIFTGVSPHGVQFVATPEPASFAFAAGGLLLLAAVATTRRRKSRLV